MLSKAWVTNYDGSRDVNKPYSGDQHNIKFVQNNIVAASFSFENQKGLVCSLTFTWIIGTASGEELALQKK